MDDENRNIHPGRSASSHKVYNNRNCCPTNPFIRLCRWWLMLRHLGSACIPKSRQSVEYCTSEFCSFRILEANSVVDVPLIDPEIFAKTIPLLLGVDTVLHKAEKRIFGVTSALILAGRRVPGCKRSLFKLELGADFCFYKRSLRTIPENICRVAL